MAKLTSIKPRLGALPPRIGYASGDEKARDQHRAATQHWRKWYKLKRWTGTAKANFMDGLRGQVLLRDGYICQRTGVLCIGKSPAPNSPVVNHKKPHRGDPALFWDIDNLEVVTKAVHDSMVQMEEKSGKAQFAAFFPDWLKPSTIPLTIVCGPPASGKSTYVARRAGRNDLVIDLDVIASRLSGGPLHAWDRERWLHPAMFQRNNLLGSLARPTSYRKAWFIVAEPTAERRKWWADHLKPDAIVVIETPEAQCIANAAKDADRDQRRTAQAIASWWASYTRRAGDIIA